MPSRRPPPRRAGPALGAAVVVVSLLLGLAPSTVGAETPTTHVVQPGETLSDIAVAAGVDAASLAALNALDDANLLSVGQALTLPPTSASAAPGGAQPRLPQGYAVAAGDTLWSVAQQLGTTTAALADANHLDDPDHLMAGTLLVVPSGAAARSAAPETVAPATPRPTAAPAPAPARRSLLVPYTVQAGETLGRIARQFETSADAIAQANGLDDPDRVVLGTVLKVPAPAREHVVQAGETLRDIAAQEKVDLGSLVDFNALDDPQLIRVGQLIVVPVAAPGQTAASNAAPPSAPAATSQAPPATAPQGTVPAQPAAAPAVARVAAKPARPEPKANAAAPVSKPARPVVNAPAGSATDGLAGVGLKLLGSPYVWGGSSPAGFDCSGFVWYVARQAGKSLSRGMLGEYAAGPHPARDELKPGDLVFFQNTYTAGLSHDGVYIGDGQFLHAADESAGVTISSLGTPFWSSHWFGATRLP